MASIAEVEVGTRELFRMFDEVSPLADKSGMFPALTAVGLESDGDYLVAVGTDRYTLGVSRLRLDEPITLPRRLLSLADVARIKRIFQPERRSRPTLRLAFSDTGISIEEAATLTTGLPSLRLGCPWIDAEPPKYRGIFTDDQASVPEGLAAGFNPSYMARFAAAQRDNEPMRVWTEGVGKLWKITVGDHFVGAVMPVRLPDDVPEPWTPTAEPATVKRGRKKAAA